VYKYERLHFMKVINLTPHPIHVVNAEGTVLKTYQSEGVVRLKATTVHAGFTIDGVPVTQTEFGTPEGLPLFEEGTFLIVSQLIKSALPGRKDLVVPAEVVRDANGNILGCRSFGI
jgi:hypothetical protein